MQRRTRLTVTALLVLSLSACGSDDGGVDVEGAWARPSAAGQTTGAVYFRLTSADDDRLLAATVPASVAGTAEVHEVVMADDAISGDATGHDMSGDDMGDMGDMGEMPMTMQELTDGLALPAGETITFEPGGYHVMLLDLVEPLDVGDEVEVTLDFETAADLTVVAEVAETAP
jgi:hypothetical protein